MFCAQQLAAFEKGLPDGKGGFRFEKTNNRGWGGWEQAKVVSTCARDSGARPPPLL